MRKNPEKQKGLHIASEIAAVTIVAPSLVYIAAVNPQMLKLHRVFLYAVAAGSLLIDGYLLAKWRDQS